jgi:Ni,Fe-hydrogenase III large subunit
VTGFDELGLRNRQTIPLDIVPDEDPGAFRATVAVAVSSGWRLASVVGLPEPDGRVRILAILADDRRGELGAVSTTVAEQYPALTPDCPEASYFERELAEQCALTPVGHPHLLPVRRHAPDHTSAAAAQPAHDRTQYAFTPVQGMHHHEVAVGPVHAGIIEPGHFRFQAYGEEVLQLEIMLGYQHRGVEPLLETLRRDRAVLVAESIAGDTVIGHTESYCSAIEALARARKTPRAQAIRGIALEIERLANHIGDLGAIAADIAYQPAAAFFGRLRGDCLNILMAMSGNRYGRGLIRPGGVSFDLTTTMAVELAETLQRLRGDLVPVADLMLSNASVQARLEGVGRLTPEAGLMLGVVGPVARACGVRRDVRHDHPYGLFRFAHVPMSTAWAGDVLARTLVRWLEIQRSLDFVVEQLAGLPKGTLRVECGALRPGELAVAMSEGWRGEIVHVAVTDGAGRIRRHKVVDPSFHNWAALVAVMPGNQISDFPLCNKSFNLSYAGHDL